MSIRTRGVALLLALSSACSPEPAAVSSAQAAAPATFRTTTPAPVRHRPSVELTGSLDPVASVQLGFDVGGRLEALLVHRGEPVRQGQALARLDAAIAESQLAQALAAMTGAEAQLAGGEAGFARAEKLKEAGAVSAQQYSDAEAAIKAARAGVEQARAAVRMARTNLDLHTLKAPFSGIVTNGPDNAGTLVGPGTPLFVVEDLSSLQIRATAPESAAWIKEGQDATVSAGVPGSAASIEAKVVRVIPSLDPSTRRIPVEIRVTSTDPSLRAHGFARATIAAGEEIPAWSVPRAAIVARPDFSVFVDAKPEPRRVPVEILTEIDGNAIIVGSLSATDAIVLDPPITLGVE